MNETFLVERSHKFWIGKVRRRCNYTIKELLEKGEIYFWASNGYYRVKVAFGITRWNRYKPRFVCPKCNREVYCLYIPHEHSGGPLCRHCYNLKYSCRVKHRNWYWEHIGKWEYKLTKAATKLQNKWLRKPTKKSLQKKADFARKKLVEDG